MDDQPGGDGGRDGDADGQANGEPGTEARAGGSRSGAGGLGLAKPGGGSGCNYDRMGKARDGHRAAAHADVGGAIKQARNLKERGGRGGQAMGLHRDGDGAVNAQVATAQKQAATLDPGQGAGAEADLAGGEIQPSRAGRDGAQEVARMGSRAGGHGDGIDVNAGGRGQDEAGREAEAEGHGDGHDHGHGGKLREHTRHARHFRFPLKAFTCNSALKLPRTCHTLQARYH